MVPPARRQHQRRLGNDGDQWPFLHQSAVPGKSPRHHRCSARRHGTEDLRRRRVAHTQPGPVHRVLQTAGTHCRGIYRGRILPYRRQGRVGRTPRGLPHHRAGQGHFQIGKRQVRRARPDRESPVGEPLDRTGLRRWLGPAGADRARCPVGCGTASAQGNCRGEPRENPPGNQPASRVA